jgi:hypothetical protein
MSTPQPLGDVDEMYYRFLDRWYDEDDRERKGFPASRPDMLTAYSPESRIPCILKEEWQTKVLDQITTMIRRPLRIGSDT